MEDNRIFICSVGEWIYSDFFFDVDKRCFTEDKYHWGYLDCELFFDGSFVVSPQKIYATFIRTKNCDGIRMLLEICINHELTFEDCLITDEEIHHHLDEVDQSLKNNMQCIDKTYVFRNKFKRIIGILFNHGPFYAYIGLHHVSKGFVTKRDAFHYAIDDLRNCYTVCNNIIDGKSFYVPVAPANDPRERGLTAFENISDILSIR